MQQGYSVSEEHRLMNQIAVFAEISDLEINNEYTCVCALCCTLCTVCCLCDMPSALLHSLSEYSCFAAGNIE